MEKGGNDKRRRGGGATGRREKGVVLKVHITFVFKFSYPETVAEDATSAETI